MAEGSAVAWVVEASDPMALTAEWEDLEVELEVALEEASEVEDDMVLAVSVQPAVAKHKKKESLEEEANTDKKSIDCR